MINAYGTLPQFGDTFGVSSTESPERKPAQVAPAAAQVYTDIAIGDELTLPLLTLVNTVFLSDSGLLAKIVYFAGVKDEGNTWAICLRAAQLLAEHGQQSVCLVDARSQTVESGRLSTTRRLYSVPKLGTSSPGRPIGGSQLWVADDTLLHKQNGNLLPLAEIKRNILALKDTFGFVIFCGPGLLSGPEACILPQMAGRVILVVEGQATTRRCTLEAARTAQRAGIEIIGTILSETEPPKAQSLRSSGKQ